jgi:hypothetical protein
MQIAWSGLLACMIFDAPAHSGGSDGFTFESHFINPPSREAPITEFNSWRAVHDFNPYYKDYRRCDGPKNESFFLTNNIDIVIDGVDSDFFHLRLFMRPIKKDYKYETPERWEARRAELTQIVKDASPVVTESFREVSRSARIDWSAVKCEDYAKTLMQHKAKIFAFNETFRPYRERIKVVREKYKTK